jgi:SAM-dependent methyltransferase
MSDVLSRLRRDRARATMGNARRETLVRCDDCGMVYVDALPDADSHEQRVGESLVYTDDQLAKREFFRRRAHELLEAIARRQGRPGRLLDVGCGIGTELEIARERGWQATGIELATGSLRVAREQGPGRDRPPARAGRAAGCGVRPRDGQPRARAHPARPSGARRGCDG